MSTWTARINEETHFKSDKKWMTCSLIAHRISSRVFDKKKRSSEIFHFGKSVSRVYLVAVVLWAMPKRCATASGNLICIIIIYY